MYSNYNYALYTNRLLIAVKEFYYVFVYISLHVYLGWIVFSDRVS